MPGPRLARKRPTGVSSPVGAEQLDPARADEDGGRLDALLGHGVAVLERRAEEPPVRLDRLVEIGHGEADVVDAPERHAAIATRPIVGAGRGSSSTSPYSTASAGVMNRSRSMSSITVSTVAAGVARDDLRHLPRRRADLAGRDLDVGRRAAEAGASPGGSSASRSAARTACPAAPPAMIIAAADIPIPKQIVETSGRTCCMAS